jgi:glutathione S-transferase
MASLGKRINNFPNNLASTRRADKLRWFTFSHPEKLPSAVERYVNEIRRVSRVLDGHLVGRQYLVGDKCTYADIAFITWQQSINKAVGDSFDTARECPNVQAWLERLLERPGVKKVSEKRAAKMAAIKK